MIGFKELQSEAILCDITIKVGSKEFPAHRNILAVSSDYFKAMFTSGFQEACSPEISIDQDSKIFEMILDFIYTGRKIFLSKNNILQVLDTAVYLQIAPIIQTCTNFLRERLIMQGSRLRTHDKLQMLSLQQAFEISQRPEPELSTVVKLAHKYIFRNLCSLSRQPEFFDQTTRECLEMILKKRLVKAHASSKVFILNKKTLSFTPLNRILYGILIVTI